MIKLDVDLAAIEQRGLASMEADLRGSIEQSGEPTDRYKLVASKMLGVPYEQVTPEQRHAAKVAMFREIYS